MELDLSMAPAAQAAGKRKEAAGGLDLSMAPEAGQGGVPGLGFEPSLAPQPPKGSAAEQFTRELNLDQFPAQGVKDVLAGSAPDTMVLGREFMRNTQPSTPYVPEKPETTFDRLARATGYESDFAEHTGFGGSFGSAAKQLVRIAPGMAKSANESLAMAAGSMDATERAVLGQYSSGLWGNARNWLLNQAESLRTGVLSSPSLSLPADKQGRLWDNPKYLLDPEWLTFNTGEAASSMVPMVVATVMSGGRTLPGAIVGSAQEAGDLYRELIKEDKADPDRALAASLVFGVAVSGLEKLGLDKVMDRGVASSFFKRGLKAAGAGLAEGSTEYMEEPIQAALQGMALGESPEELRARVLDALKNVDVIPGSFLLGGGMSMSHTRSEQRAAKEQAKAGKEQAGQPVQPSPQSEQPGATAQAAPAIPAGEAQPRQQGQTMPREQDLPSGEDVMPYTREDAHEVLRRHYGEEQAAPAIALWDAVADSWAEREGGTREGFYEKHLAGIVSPPSHETPQNSPEYSYRPDAQERDPQAKGMAAEALRDALRPLQDSAKNALPLDVVQSLDELPEHLRRDAEQGEGTPTAVYDPATKRVYMLAEAIDTPAQAAALWMHEQGAHVGLRGLLGDQLDPFLDRVAEHVGREALAGIAEQHGIDLTSEEGLRHAAEEHLAGMAERIRAGEELSEAEQGVWDQLVAMLRDWLKDMGVVDPEALTDADLANAVRAAIRWTRYGEAEATTANPRPSFSKAQLNQFFEESLKHNLAWRLKSYLLYDVDPLGEQTSSTTVSKKKSGGIVSGVFGLKYDDAVYHWGKEGLEGIQRGLVRKDGIPLDKLMQNWGIEDANVVFDALHFNKAKAREKFIAGGGSGMLYQPANPDVHPEAKVKVVNLDGVQGFDLGSKGAKAFVERWKGATLAFDGGRWKAVLSAKDQDHAFWSSDVERRNDKTRLAALSVLDEVVSASKLVETVKPKHPGVKNTLRFYAPVIRNGKLSTIRVVAHELEGKTLQVDGAEIYDVIKEKRPARHTEPEGLARPAGQGVSEITIKQMLSGVKDATGKPYYTQDAAPGSTAYSDRTAKQAGPRAGVQFLDDGRAIIHLFQSADASSVIHETGHILRRMLPEADQRVIEAWCKVEDGVWTREAEEQFAKGFERYVYEGQAPTSRLRRAFQTLRNMLVRIYGSIRNIGGVKLSPEVRQVFDRLVSTQAEREAEAQAADSVHSFRVDEDAGMPGYAEELPASFTEIKEYEDLMAEAERLAYERFDKERRKEHRALRAQWRAEAREIVDSYLPHRAMDAAVALGGLDHAMVSEAYDAEFVRLLTMKRPGLVKRGTGVSPDAVALEHGYTDAHDMLEDILDVPAKGQIITDYMARREEAYQRQRALDNDFGGDYMAVQEAALEILSKITKAQNRRIETMQARATVDELRMYDLAKLRAQARAERTRLQDQAKQAFNTGDTRRAQVLLNQMSQNDLLLREMERALAEREKMERSARTMLSRKIDEEWRQQARNWAGLFGLGGAKSEGGGPDLLDFLAAKGLHHFVDQEAIASLSRVPKGALSVDQYRDAHRVLRQIIHFGTWDTRIMGQQKAQEFDAVMGQVLGTILAKGPASPAVNIHPDPLHDMRRSSMGEFLDGVSAYHAELLKPEHIFRQLDGHQDMGAVWSACFKPIAESRGDFLKLGEEVQAKLQAAFAPVHKELAAWRKKFITIPEVPRNVIIRKGKQVEIKEGAPLQMTMERIVMVALNSGNDGNREAIKAGFQWTEGDLAAILSRLGEREWAVVHQVWDAIEAIYPHLNRAHKRLTGVELKKVQALPFVATTQSGQQIEVKGGYFPLIFDRKLALKADRQAAQAEMQDLFQSIYQKPNPKSGFTKERVGGRMAPRLDFGVIARHVLDTAHYATHAVAIRDVQKITTDPRFREAVESSWSRPVYEQIAPWLQNVARPAKAERSRMEQHIARARRNVQIVAMGWKPFTAFLQLTSLTSTAYKVGWAQTARTLGSFIAHPHDAMDFVRERSIALRNRSQSFDRDVVDMLGQFDPSKNSMLDTVHRTAFALIGVVDSFVACVTWQAAYTQAMEQNGWNEEKACEYADMTVRLSQGDGAAMSLARVQHGSELRKFVTMFYSWFSANYNNIAEANRKAFGEGASLPKTVDLAKAYWWLLIAPAVLEQLLRKGPPDDDKEKRDLGLSIFSYFMSSFPILRSMWEYGVVKMFPDSRVGSRELQISPVQDVFEAPGELIGALQVKKDRGRKVAEKTLMAVGYLWGLPTRQAVTVMDAALDMADGKTRNPLRFIVPAPKDKKGGGQRVTYGGN